MSKSLEEVMLGLNKDFKAEVINEGTKRVYCKKIPFSSPTANFMTYGGVPLGKATEFFGGEGGGKTSSALDIVANAQVIFEEEYKAKITPLKKELKKAKEKGKAKEIKAAENKLQSVKRKRCLYIDLENTLDLDWAEKLGVDTGSNLIFMRPENQTAEQILQAMIDLIDTGEIGLCVLDSIPCLVPQQIFEESMEKKAYAGVSGPMSIFCAKITPYLTRTECALIFINQVREDLSSTYSSVSTPGGKALKHLYSLRLRFRKGDYLDKSNKEIPRSSINPAGNKVQIEVVKTKVCKPDRRLGYYTLNYYSGIDETADTIAMAIEFGAIIRSGSWFSILDIGTGEILSSNGKELKFQGQSELYKFLIEDEEVFFELKEDLEKLIAKEN